MDSKIKLHEFSYDLPATIDPSSKFLFFLHGMLSEFYGPNGIHPVYGAYDYYGIVRAFADREFIVVSEVRRRGINPYKYAGRVARQIRTLLSNNVSPEQISVAGFSKGGFIALYAAEKLKNPKVNFVVMAGFNNKADRFLGNYKKQIRSSSPFMQGRFLYIYNGPDIKCIVCQRAFELASDKITYSEIKIDNGLGHGLFYQPRDAWIEPVVEWINNKH